MVRASEKGVADCTGCGSKNERKRRRARQTEREESIRKQESVMQQDILLPANT